MKKIFVIILSISICFFFFAREREKEIIQRDTSTWKTYSDVYVHFSYPDTWRIESPESNTETNINDWNVQLYNYPEQSFGGEMFTGNDTKISIYFATTTDAFFSDPQITSFTIAHPNIDDLFLTINMYHAKNNHSNEWIAKEIIRSIKWQ